MVERLSEYIVQWLIKNEVICEEERELYEYATFNRIFTLLPFLVIIPFCLMTGTIMNGIVVCAVFLSLRKYTGGYHAKTSMQCWIYSSLLVIAVIYGTTEIENNVFVFLFLLLAVCSIWVLSPIDSENRRLDVSEKRKYRKYSRCISLLLFVLYGVVSILNKNALAVIVAVGTMFVSVLQLIGLFEQQWNNKGKIAKKQEICRFVHKLLKQKD